MSGIDGARMIGAAVLAAVGLGVVACSSAPPPPPAPPTYTVMITEPSGNIGKGIGNGQLFVHWSCDPTVDPATRYQGAQDALWTDVDGTKGQAVLRTQASCSSGALLTVQVDAAVVSYDYSPTRLRCEVFDAGGQHVADESVTRGLGTSDPVCRVSVP